MGETIKVEGGKITITKFHELLNFVTLSTDFNTTIMAVVCNDVTPTTVWRAKSALFTVQLLKAKQEEFMLKDVFLPLVHVLEILAGAPEGLDSEGLKELRKVAVEELVIILEGKDNGSDDGSDDSTK